MITHILAFTNHVTCTWHEWGVLLRCSHTKCSDEVRIKMGNAAYTKHIITDDISYRCACGDHSLVLATHPFLHTHTLQERTMHSQKLSWCKVGIHWRNYARAWLTHVHQCTHISTSIHTWSLVDHDMGCSLHNILVRIKHKSAVHIANFFVCILGCTERSGTVCQ
jgi:hypothetical protein